MKRLYPLFLLLFVVFSGVSILMFSTPALSKSASFKLKAYCYGGPVHLASKHLETYLSAVAEKSKGQISYRIYYAGELIKTKEALDAIRTGSIDILVSTPSYYSGKVAIGDILTFPMMYKNIDDLVDIWQNTDMRDLISSVYEKQYNGKILTFMPMGTMCMESSKKIESFNDFKGAKIRSIGGAFDQWFKSIGAEPVMLPRADVYTALHRKTVDAALDSVWGVKKLKYYEITKYLIMPSVGAYGQPLWINVNVWSKMPSDLKKIFLDVGRKMENKIKEEQKVAEKESIEFCKNYGMEIIYLSNEDMAKLRRASYSTSVLSYVKRAGPVAQEIIDIIKARKN